MNTQKHRRTGFVLLMLPTQSMRQLPYGKCYQLTGFRNHQPGSSWSYLGPFGSYNRSSGRWKHYLNAWRQDYSLATAGPCQLTRFG
ncbi:hypothetical protein CC77DRAFT_1021342 [Alternaria alternata]|uniref:Uncharacterized protein n=1 Tax=Alternaria alternata TaxID=5599 RepID=A0A177DIK5_ALTAL|nr:hypothetical protein CC77DRAFT_1021342 [Alternaria alternata]OAG19167.1 hypothetical protein CC77DRAFT_1021342 [Alternaria alternata]